MYKIIVIVTIILSTFVSCSSTPKKKDAIIFDFRIEDDKISWLIIIIGFVIGGIVGVANLAIIAVLSFSCLS